MTETNTGGVEEPVTGLIAHEKIGGGECPQLPSYSRIIFTDCVFTGDLVFPDQENDNVMIEIYDSVIQGSVTDNMVSGMLGLENIHFTETNINRDQ